jgi:hypothetical protein
MLPTYLSGGANFPIHHFLVFDFGAPFSSCAIRAIKSSKVAAKWQAQQLWL